MCSITWSRYQRRSDLRARITTSSVLSAFGLDVITWPQWHQCTELVVIRARMSDLLCLDNYVSDTTTTITPPSAQSSAMLPSKHCIHKRENHLNRALGVSTFRRCYYVYWSCYQMKRATCEQCVYVSSEKCSNRMETNWKTTLNLPLLRCWRGFQIRTVWLAKLPKILSIFWHLLFRLRVQFVSSTQWWRRRSIPCYWAL